MDAKHDLETFTKWSKVGKVLSIGFLALMVISIVAALYEYHTMEDEWMLPATLTFLAAVVLGIFSTMAMRLQRHWKDRAIASLEQEVAAHEKTQKT